MSFEILRTDTFSKNLKSLTKKYPSLKKDYTLLLEMLAENPLSGVPLGKNCYKVRMRISAKNSGKSGGARVITYVKVLYKRITLLDIYDKAEKDSISEKELSALINKAE
jgi:mRNA-degrading endonuclease RelE of RelBE toxin-antitoxin system